MPNKLDLVYVSLNPDSIFFQFYLLDDGGNQRAAFGFQSWGDHDAIPNAGRIESTLTSGQWTVIPFREPDAFLRTVSKVPSTWAVTKYPVRLSLGGWQNWEWECTFENAIFPFKFDGTWTRKW